MMLSVALQPWSTLPLGCTQGTHTVHIAEKNVSFSSRIAVSRGQTSLATFGGEGVIGGGAMLLLSL